MVVKYRSHACANDSLSDASRDAPRRAEVECLALEGLRNPPILAVQLIISTNRTENKAESGSSARRMKDEEAGNGNLI